MKTTLTRTEMLDRWRLHRGFDIPHFNAGASRTDGIDLDSILAAEMDEWYANLLHTAPVRHLAPVDIASSMASAAGEGGVMRLNLSLSTVRVAAVRLSSWRRAATVVTDPSCRVAQNQFHPFTRASAHDPVAVFDPVGKTLDLYPCHSRSDRIVTLSVVEFHPDEFSFDSSALSLI